MLKINLTKIFIFYIIIILIFFANNIYSQTISTQIQTQILNPQTTQTQSSPQSSSTTTINIQEDFELKSKLIDVSFINSYTFRSQQITMSLGLQAGIFILSFFEIGAKFSFESFKTYKYIYEPSIFIKLFFIKKGDTNPFFYLDSGFGIGEKLKGIVLRPGIGLLQRIKGILNLNLCFLVDLWFFTYRFNSDSIQISKDELVLSKFHYDIRVLLGFNFIF